MSKNQFGIDKIIVALGNMRDEIPMKLANQAQNFFIDNFRRQGFLDGSTKPWAEVKRRIPGTNAYKYPLKKDLGRHERAILQGKGSGQLRKGVNNSIKKATFSLVKLVVDVPYASYLNEGTSKMPARKFMGDSITLKENQVKLIKQYIDNAFKK